MKIVTKILIITYILVSVSSCKTTNDLYRNYNPLTGNKGVPLITLIEDNIENSNSNTFNEIETAANYSKFVVNRTKLSSFNQDGKLPPSSRLVCIEETYPINEKGIDSLHTFVARGGTIFLTKQNFDERMAFLMGLSPSYKMVENTVASGIRFKENIFPDTKGLSMNNGNVHHGISREYFLDDVKILATADNDREYPVITINEVGKGKVVLFNSNIDFDKERRGLVFAQLLLGLEGIPYPVANVANVHLDDFPAPVYNVKKEPVKTQLRLTMAEFITDVWWPDMKALAKKHNLKYTAYPAFDYNYTTTPPFVFEEWESNRFMKDGYEQEISSWLGTDVIANGHEMGFHGYNHVSLTTEEWKEPEDMVAALKTVTKKWKTSKFKNLPTSYVPPSNIIDSVGLAKLEEGMPSLKYIQSVYMGELEHGGNREFGPDPFNSYFFDVPRVSSGYFLTDHIKLNISSLFLFTGIWTHFVHPDDVFQIPDPSNKNTSGGYLLRNRYELPWSTHKGKKGLLETFDQELINFKKHYPLTRFTTATDAADLIVKWRYANYEHIIQDGIYAVLSEDFSKEDNFENYWFTYISKTNDPVFERNLESEMLNYHKTECLDGFLYQIKTDDAFVSWVDLKYLNNSTNNEQISNLFDERKEFETTKYQLLPFLRKLEKLEELGQLSEAATLFEKQTRITKNLPRKEWMTYAKILSWNNNPERFWNFLEKTYKNKPSKRLANIALKAKSEYGTPNEAVSERWMLNAISWDLGGVKTLRKYLSYYQNEDNHENIKMVMKKIANLTKSDDDKIDFIKYLIDTKDDDVEAQLDGVDPCQYKYQRVALEVALYYADNFDFYSAYNWANCIPGFDKDTKEDWFYKSKNFEELKQTDKKTYYNILLRKDEKRAFKELKEERDSKNELKPLANKITMLFGDLEDYESAIEWSNYANDLPVVKLLTWNYELNNRFWVEKIYQDYMVDHPEAYDVMIHMAKLYLYMDNLEEMAKIVSKLPTNTDFVHLRGLLNKNVRYADLKTKRLIANKYGDLLSERTKKDIKHELRQKEGNDIFVNGSSMNDRFDPTQLEFIGGFTLTSKGFTNHTFAGVRGFVFPINFIENEADNQERDLVGFEYRLAKQLNTKNKLVMSARLERDNLENLFYHAGLTWQLSGEHSFLSTQLNYRPVQTGPGYVRNIYQGIFASYYEPVLNTFLKPIFTLEGNHYSDGNFDATFNSRFEAKLVKSESFELAPLIEGAYSIASEDRRDGFPYWMADKRLIAGGGLAIRIGKQEQRFFLDTSATIFYENQGEPTFERYLANLNMKIRKYFILTAGAELYTIESFFSNAFNAGMRYNF